MKRVIGVPPEAGSKLFGIAIEFWLDEQVKASNNWFAALPDGDALTWIFRACRRLPTGWTSSTDGWCVARRGDDCCGFAARDARDVQRVVVFALQRPRFGCGSSRNLGTRWRVRFVIAALRGFGATSVGGEGVHRVGSAIQAGIYEIETDADECHWARLSNFQGTEDRVIEEGGYSADRVVHIRGSDRGF